MEDTGYIADKEIVSKIRNLFARKELTLSIAESCTGGLVSSMLTDERGASKFFKLSVVTYSNDSKTKILGLSSRLIKEHGVISEDAAVRMSGAVEKLSGSDVGLAITGNLGPDAMEDRKPGLVYIAITSGQSSTSRGFIFDGDRKQVKKDAANAALQYLYEAVSAWS